MDLALIERLITMFGRSDLATLEVTEGNLTIRMARAGGLAPAAGPAMAEPDLPTAEGTVVLRAGMAGTFYRAPAPGAEPFVREGDIVEEGSTLGLVEAMKMLNPVEAEQAGRILRIHLADATPVEPGMALFDLEPGGA